MLLYIKLQPSNWLGVIKTQNNRKLLIIYEPKCFHHFRCCHQQDYNSLREVNSRRLYTQLKLLSKQRHMLSYIKRHHSNWRTVTKIQSDQKLTKIYEQKCMPHFCCCHPLTTTLYMRLIPTDSKLSKNYYQNTATSLGMLSYVKRQHFSWCAVINTQSGLKLMKIYDFYELKMPTSLPLLSAARLQQSKWG